ncbi:Swt1 family HEPN domain-containing protein [Knoellia sp. 3-2P3]|uniref:Swt1 family HEPN domain-containing protein n=1 Tax=unclassified Knoellia TaxID=2618719 RepID=UPI0023D97B62|nr:Swt1 family HEPN domain-containing protein [Knoellia sp. 3-2P3]MDF2092588.1 Swt1 family HEPN domain-containing protein [Knoellia sp. 3-2P3]
MALSNRDRVGKAFELLRDGLRPFIDQTIGRLAPGADWAAMLGEVKGKKVDAEDVQAHLMLLTERFPQLFKDQLPYAARNYANELRDQRNAWAHLKAFSNDDTHRMLDNAERLLTLVGAVEQSEEVRRSKSDHQRSVFEAETKKLVKQQDAGVSVAGQGLKPWREVLAPHDDVATGNFSASEFAADLHMVAFAGDDETLGREYVDPVEFFRRTYLTEGLRELLDRAVRRVGGDANASPIINLQTNFGGGKTHSMLALYHLLSGTPVSSLPQDIQELVAGRALPDHVSRVVLVGTHLSPGSATIKDDGTEVHTLWGELAWQLGGRAAYDLIADADRSKTNPGDVLRKLISAHAPCLILIDEWVAYARQLWGREDLVGGTFDTQFTFAQSLTEVVKTVPGALLVISIPASHDPEKEPGAGGSAIEVGGPNGQEALQRLQNVVRRVADQWRPASSQESFEIVRRRLFTEPSAAASADIAAVARQFTQFYARHIGEFPREVSEPAYEARIKAAYPLHPELFDRLYEDWSTLERFQRTRGVLRLMSAVVHALWTAQDAAPMILPGTVPLDVATVASEMTQYLPDSWKPIIDTDIDGQSSTPIRIDTERPLLGSRAVTRRLARSIFIASAPTLRSGHKGVERQRIWLGTAVPGDTVGNFGSGLDLLSQRATYLYAEGARYWYDTQASVTRTAADYADGLREKPEEAWAEIVHRLRPEASHRGGFAAVVTAPETSADIQDREEVSLVILHPSQTHSRGSQDSDAMRFAGEAFERRGSAQRSNRNMVVFLAPDSKRMEELADSVRHYLAWSHVGSRRVELDLSPQQVSQVEGNITRFNDDVASRVAQTYHWALVPEQPHPARPAVITPEKAEGANARLAERVTEKLTRSGLLAGSVAARSVRLDLDQRLRAVWDRGHISVGELWGYYCKYPYLTRLRDRSVLVDGVLSTLSTLAWQLEGFALADSYDEANGRYAGLVLPGGDAHFGTVTDATLLVAHGPAEEQTAREKTEPAPGPDQPDNPVPPGPAVLPAPGPGVPPAAENTRFFGVFTLDPERYARDLTRVSQEVLQQLAAVDGSTLEVTLEIHASAPQGYAPEKVRVVLENARTLKFQQYSFDDE